MYAICDLVVILRSIESVIQVQVQVYYFAIKYTKQEEVLNIKKLMARKPKGSHWLIRNRLPQLINYKYKQKYTYKINGIATVVLYSS